MAPPSDGWIWHGSADHPHTTDAIVTMKTCLMDGYRVTFREGNSSIWIRQGPENHKRTAPFGVLLSAISDSHEHSELAKRIDRGKFIYLVKIGDSRPIYASPHEYTLPSSDGPPCTATQAITVGPAQFILNSSALTTRTLRALSYGGGALAVQSFGGLQGT